MLLCNKFMLINYSSINISNCQPLIYVVFPSRILLTEFSRQLYPIIKGCCQVQQ